YERKGDVVGDIDKLVSLSLLYDDVADIAGRGNRCLIESRRLSRMPLNQEICAAYCASAPEQRERPCFVMSGGGLDRDHALHRLHTVRERSIIKEGPWAGRVIAVVGVASVIARAGVAGDQHLAWRQALPESVKRFEPRWNEPQAPPGHGADDGLTCELLPPAFRLPVVHH